MAITLGSVTVDPDGSRSGSGVCLALYDSRLAVIEAAAAPEVLDLIAADPSVAFDARTQLAETCTADAEVMVDVASGVYGDP